MEGGANVVVEAVTCGTPVLASRISGNVGMLGEDYAGYFPPGDAAALAERLVALHGNRAALARLETQCAARAALFTPAAERAALLGLLEAARRRVLRVNAAPSGRGPQARVGRMAARLRTLRKHR